jgi:hypothetical protein
MNRELGVVIDFTTRRQINEHPEVKPQQNEHRPDPEAIAAALRALYSHTPNEAFSHAFSLMNTSFEKGGLVQNALLQFTEEFKMGLYSNGFINNAYIRDISDIRTGPGQIMIDSDLYNSQVVINDNGHFVSLPWTNEP